VHFGTLCLFQKTAKAATYCSCPKMIPIFQ